MPPKRKAPGAPAVPDLFGGAAAAAAEAADRALGGRYEPYQQDIELDVLRRFFNDIDSDFNGSITPSELKAYYSRAPLKVNLFDSEIDDMIQEADIANYDGRIQFNEFCAIIRKAQNHKTSVKWEKVSDHFSSELRAYRGRIAAAAAAAARDAARIQREAAARAKAAAKAAEAAAKAEQKALGGSTHWFRISDEERAVMRRHFNDIDRDLNGSITAAELKAYYTRVTGVKLFDSEIAEMVRDADIANYDGKIQLGEFTDMVMRAKSLKSSVKWSSVYDHFAGELAVAAAPKRGRR